MKNRVHAACLFLFTISTGNPDKTLNLKHNIFHLVNVVSGMDRAACLTRQKNCFQNV